MNKKIFIFLSLSAIVLFITSCDLNLLTPFLYSKLFYTGQGYSEDWIAVSNIDGTDLQYLCRGNGTPYFVPDLENTEQELLMLDCCTHIDLMNLDGSNRRTIIDSVGSIYSFSSDRTKMLLNMDGEIYMANTDGTEFKNLTGTPDIREIYPSFSPDNRMIVYVYGISDKHAFLAIKDIEINKNEIICDYKIENSNQSINFRYPFFKNNDEILYSFRYKEYDKERYIAKYEIHKVPLKNGDDEIIYSSSNASHFTYHFETGLAIIYTAGTSVLFDVNSMEIEDELIDLYYYDEYCFSPNGGYLTINKFIYRISDGTGYYIDTKINDFNRNETRIVGIASRYY